MLSGMKSTGRVSIRLASGVTPPLLIFNGIGANLELIEPFVAALEGVETVCPRPNTRPQSSNSSEARR
jgi:hypothetical protein